MFAQLRNALARNASVFQTARTASTGANGKAWAVDLMASEAGISKKQAEIALKPLLAGIEGAVVNGERVTFQGFGSFESVARAARTGVNPQNPTQKINIPASIANSPSSSPMCPICIPALSLSPGPSGEASRHAVSARPYQRRCDDEPTTKTSIGGCAGSVGGTGGDGGDRGP